MSNYETLSKEQKRLVKKIMKREDPQRKVDKIVYKTKKAMEICQRESTQTKVDKIVEEELKKL